MNEDQLQRLLAAARPPPTAGNKIEKFSSGNPEDWITWRTQFTTIKDICGWDHRRSRRELRAAMTGTAARIVEDIPINADIPAPQNVTFLLAEYELRFCPVAASDTARAELKHSSQRENETILQWHGRVRANYRLAYPDQEPAELNLNRDLIDYFVLGIADAAVRNEVYKVRPATFPEALVVASNHTAANAILTGQATSSGLVVKKEEGHIGAMQGPFGGCYWCGGDHYKADCVQYRGWLRTRRDGRGRGRGRGSSGSFRGPRRGRGGRGRINSNSRPRGGFDRKRGQPGGRRDQQQLRQVNMMEEGEGHLGSEPHPDMALGEDDLEGAENY